MIKRHSFSLRTKFLLTSLLPTLGVVTVIVSLFIMEFNRLVLQRQVDELLTVPQMLENTINSPEVLNYRHLIQNGVYLLNNLRKDVTGITVYAHKDAGFEVIAATDQKKMGSPAPKGHMIPFETGRYAISEEVIFGQKILRLNAPIFSGTKPVAVISITASMRVYTVMMSYLRNLIFFIAPAGGILLWIAIYFSFKNIFLSRLSNLSLASKEISEGKWPSKILVKWQDEMGELEETFNQMSLSRQKAEEALEEQAIRDALTKLYNRRYFDTRIGEEISRALRRRNRFAVLLCDLDLFKDINDSLGHQAGDTLLKAVAHNLKAATRGADLLFRWGGDEFVIILPELTEEDGAVGVANRIRAGVQSIKTGTKATTDISIGVAYFPEHGSDAQALIRVADHALYIAKKGGDKVHVGEEEFHLSENAITVVFQPIVDVRSGTRLAHEALSRDPSGKMGILSLFKKYQAIGQLRELKKLCFKTQLVTAKREGLSSVFINVDFELLSDLEVFPIPSGIEIVLEVSELEALNDIESHLKEAERWRQEGYQFALDDFGAGFISLSFISQLVPEYIKIDRSAILRANASEEFKQFLSDLVKALGNYTKKGIIAEGVETKQELAMVEEIGIHLIQGFLFGKPKKLDHSKTEQNHNIHS